MHTSETVDALAAALAKAQGQMSNASLNKSNPHFRSKYADLSAIREAVTKPLADNAISYVQMTGTDENGQFVLFTRLMHSSGQWMESRYPLPINVDKMQAMGSAISYARRYSLAAICGIAADEDDDAETAPNNQPAQPQASKTHQANAQRGQQRPAGDPIKVIDADGQEQEYPRTRRGALSAMKCVEDELARTDHVEAKAAIWEANRETFLTLAEKVGDARPAEGAQSIKERVTACDQALYESMKGAA